jgi:hypothetical protein
LLKLIIEGENMKQFKIMIFDQEEIIVNEGTTFNDILMLNKVEGKIPVVLAKFNNGIYELLDEVKTDGRFETIDISCKIGIETYVNHGAYFGKLFIWRNP